MTSIYYHKTVISGQYVETYSYARAIARGFKAAGDRCGVRHNEERREDNVFRAKKRLFRLIQANCVKVRPLFLTLTYEQNMTDRAQAVIDVSTFMIHLRRELPSVKYLYVLEQQERGAWHAHIALFGQAFVPFEVINSIWKTECGGGRTDIKKYNDPLHLGHYLAKYLGKEFVANGVRHRLYNASMNLIKPEEFRTLKAYYLGNRPLRFLAESPILNPITNNIALMRVYIYDGAT